MRIAGLSAALALLLAAALFMPGPITAPAAGSVHMEELTWVELRQAVRAGATVAIVPTGGVEQNGPHMALGKHNYIVRHTAGRIAETLGNALVAPVVSYVPEGAISPPTGHMAFAGTISVPETVFAGILTAAARSLRAHGFKAIAFVGDSGGNQRTQARVAAMLDAEWASAGVRVLHVGDYYAANGQIAWLMARGETRPAIGTHAGIRDTSELMAVFPEGVRTAVARPQGGAFSEPTGVNGDPSRASAARGVEMLRLKIDAAVRQIRRALATPAS